jgi:hypothetical protein
MRLNPSFMRDTPGKVPGKQVTLVRGAAMLRKLACVGIVLTFCLSVSMADEFLANIKKIEGDKVTFVKGKKGEAGQEMTLPAAKDVKITKGKFNKDTKKVEAGDEVTGGLKAEALSNIGEKGMFGYIVTDPDNKKITEIRLFGGKKKKGA